MTYSILITTKNRLEELKLTLLKCNDLISRSDVETIICDDGSNDGTYNYIKSNFPAILLIKNPESKGLIYSRNKLLAMSTAKYAISLDDDSHFLSSNPLEIIKNYFESHPKCGVQAFRILWGKKEADDIYTQQKPHRVKSFIGCGHVWRMATWKEIPDYPEWFDFYGEEEFASYHLFKKDWEVHYLPDILIHHRADVQARKKEPDYINRLKLSLRAAWYLYLLFIPLQYIPRKLGYSIWMQLKLKVFKGEYKILWALTLAMGDVLFHIFKLIKHRNPLTEKEYRIYLKILDTKIYWKPEFENPRNLKI